MSKKFAISTIETLRQHGFQAYLVGGCVRDLLLGREPADFDVATSATPTQVMETFPETYAVGAVALDRSGNIAAATSTGGTLNKAPGRLGDSSLIGCGCYADNLSAAASTTGWGEPIMKLVLAKWTADRVSAGNLPEWAAQEAMNYLKQRLNGHGGIIVLNAQGQFGIAHNTPRMAWACKTAKKEEAGIERGAM